MKLRRFAILSSVFVCFSTAAPAFARTIVVDNDFADCPQADFERIQLAVAAAAPGDKILVCPGIYAESVVVEKSDLRIEAQAAPGEVVLQGTSAQLAGFYLLNTTGVLVQGFTVQGFGTPLVGSPLTQGANIRIEGGSRNTLRKNVTTLSLMGDGIQVINSSANVVEQNSSFNNLGTLSDGITVTGSGTGEATFDNIIRHNETFLNGQTGINIIGPTAPGNVVFGNRSHHNHRIGIRNVALLGAAASGAPGNVIENNHVFANGFVDTVPVPPPAITAGILVGASTDVTVRNNRSERNNQSGVRLQNGAASNLVEKNEVFQNSEDGILLQNSADLNTVLLNVVRRNGRDGIRIFDPASDGNRIERNVMRENAEHDAHDDGTANVWLNNKCETEDQPGLCEHPDH